MQTEEKTTISYLATNVALLVIFTHKTIVYEMLHTWIENLSNSSETVKLKKHTTAVECTH